MAKINSRAKGAQGEREWAEFLRANGRPGARRGVQHKGGPESPDVLDPGSREHWEVKRVEALSLYQALDQAKRDAGEGMIPAVAHRRNRREWVVILPAADYLKLSAEAALWRAGAREPGDLTQWWEKL